MDEPTEFMLFDNHRTFRYEFLASDDGKWWQVLAWVDKVTLAMKDSEQRHLWRGMLDTAIRYGPEAVAAFLLGPYQLKDDPRAAVEEVIDDA